MPPKQAAVVKRKTRAWEPTPAVSMDDLPAESQNVANQGRPKRVKRFRWDSPAFILDYNRSREISRALKGKGKPLDDEAEIARRQLRPWSSLRPPPLSLAPPATQTSTQPKKKPKPPKGHPSGGPGGGSGGPGGGTGGPGGGGEHKGKTTVSAAPVTSAAVSSAAPVTSAAVSSAAALKLGFGSEPDTLDSRLAVLMEKYKYLTHPRTGTWDVNDLRRELRNMLSSPLISESSLSLPTKDEHLATVLEIRKKVEGLEDGIEPIILRYKYLAEDIMLNEDPFEYWYLERLITEIRQRHKDGRAMKFRKRILTTERPAPKEKKYRIPDDALGVYVRLYDDLVRPPNAKFRTREGLATYLRQLYETGESMVKALGPREPVIPELIPVPPSSTGVSTPGLTVPKHPQSVEEYTEFLQKTLASIASTSAAAITQTTKPMNPFSAAVSSPIKAKFQQPTTTSQVSKDGFGTSGIIKDVITPLLKGTIVYPASTAAQVGPSSTTATTQTVSEPVPASSTLMESLGNILGIKSKTAVPPLKKQPNIGFHYISDLHLEQTYYDNFDFEPTAQYLILAGDIGYAHPDGRHAEFYQGFLARMCAKPQLKRIFLVAGNRDFWPIDTNTVDGALGILRGFAQHPDMKGKLTFMENEKFVIEEGGGKIVILGCTLWTAKAGKGNRTNYEPKGQGDVERTARHNASCDWIREETAKIRNDPKEAETRILIITHMPPSKSGTSDPKQTTKNARDWTAGTSHGSDVIDGVKGKGYDHSSIKTTMPLLDHRDVWIWGHTHWNEPKYGKTRHGGMRFECNQRGNAKGGKYDPKPKGSFQPEKVILV